MTITAGTRLGPYEILGLIGRGGMGEVYRARDTRLNRDVAIKVLPPGVADNPVRRARFEREAQAISQLSHPNICAIYDVGDIDGTTYLVMEYIEGESLDERLRRGPLPWPMAVPLAIQMASAIEAAHKRGIVHRDLKPANVMVNEAGVKLLDFGLAKLIDTSDAASGSSEQRPQPPTLSLTAEQKIVGTIHYMSPEQLEGRPVDHRTDIFAFGTMLYEMLTARRAFDGSSAASISAAILTTEPPPVSSSPSDATPVPATLDHVIRRAIAKDPNDRWQSARDVIVELQWIQDGRSGSAVVSRSPRPWRRLAGAAAAVAAATAVLILIGAEVAWRSIPPSAPRGHAETFEIPPPEGTRFDPAADVASVSPDGQRIAFVARTLEGNNPVLYVKRLEATEIRPIPGGTVHNLFWSPDSASIAYFNDNRQLIRIDLAENVQHVLCDPPTPNYKTNPTGIWLENGTIVITDTMGLYRINASGGPLERVTTTNSGSFPYPMTGGRFLTQKRVRGIQDPQLNVETVDGKTLATLPIKSTAAYTDGLLVFRETDSLMAQAFDDKRLQLTGKPVVLTPPVQFNPANERTTFSVGAETLVYREAQPNRLVWKDRRGTPIGFVGEPGRAFNPVIAPDGVRVAVDQSMPPGHHFRIAVFDSPEAPARALSYRLSERFPIWSTDGQWIAYTEGLPEGGTARARPDGSKVEEAILGEKSGAPIAWSPDDKFIVTSRADPPGFWALPVQSPGAPSQAPFRVAASPTSREMCACAAMSFSPDGGHWVAYSFGDGDKGSEVWIQEFPGGGKKVQVAPAGANPLWRNDGKELFYETLDGSIVSVHVTLGASLTLGKPTVLFKNKAGNVHLYRRPFAVSPDGQRFLVNELGDVPDRLIVMLHWTSLVR